MLHRTLALPLHRAAQRSSPVLVQGPRGSGKTSLLCREFPGHTYISLDHAPDRARARTDSAAFLARLRGPAIVDDLHRAPELAGHLRQFPAPAHLLLASSRRIELPNAETLELHPPTTAERQRRLPVSIEMLGRFAPAPVEFATPTTPWPVTRGFLECDVRDLISVHDLDRFEQFAQIALAGSGALLDQQALADQCAMSHRTVVRWLSVLDSCFQILRLLPASVDLGRRVLRRPILHFLQGGGFASQAVSEIYRNTCHAGEAPNLRHWCDSNGFAIPLVVETDNGAPVPVFIVENPTPKEMARLKRWMELADVPHGAMIGRARVNARGGPILRYALEQL